MAQQIRASQPRFNDNSHEIGAAEAESLLDSYILMELVLEVARSSDDPQLKLAELFDRVTARARLGGHATEMGSVMSRFRTLAQEFFLLAGQRA